MEGRNKAPCGFASLLEASRDETHPELFLEAIRETNWDPCCISRDIKEWLPSNDRPVEGILMGLEIGASLGASFTTGRELIILAKGGDALEVGVVEYEGVSASLGLPAGASITQGVLLDRCESLEDYLGYFHAAVFAGMAENRGSSAAVPFVPGAATGCNAATLTSGATTSLIGAGGSYYRKASEFVELRGPRIHRMLQFFKDARSPGAFRPERYTRPGCQDQLPVQMAGYFSRDLKRRLRR
ncbi:MAG: hypothetical protein NDJ89_04495 [Oligoflexia bacterium]|nr:hypothetical protein [Oligoflexia bacterium]